MKNYKKGTKIRVMLEVDAFLKEGSEGIIKGMSSDGNCYFVHITKCLGDPPLHDGFGQFPDYVGNRGYYISPHALEEIEDAGVELDYKIY